MPTSLTIVAFSEGAPEAARLIDVRSAPLASVLEPVSAVAPDDFRKAVVSAALDYDGGGVAGVLFNARWGGGGVMLT